MRSLRLLHLLLLSGLRALKDQEEELIREEGEEDEEEGEDGEEVGVEQEDDQVTHD